MTVRRPILAANWKMHKTRLDVRLRSSQTFLPLVAANGGSSTS